MQSLFTLPMNNRATKALATLLMLASLAACSNNRQNNVQTPSQPSVPTLPGINLPGTNLPDTQPTPTTPSVGAGTPTGGGACAAQYANGTAPRLINTKLAAKTRPLCFSEFAVLHSGVTRTPLWASEHLTKTELLAEVDRKDSFHAEPALPESERAELADYASSGYDRGHLAPAGDMPTPQAMKESFTLANMTPQNPSNNRGLWSSLEARARGMAQQRGELYVVSGAIFAGAALQRLNERVLIPTGYFKAIYDPKTKESGAYLVTNDANKAYKTVSIAELAQVVGVDPFPGINATSKQTAMTLP